MEAVIIELLGNPSMYSPKIQYSWNMSSVLQCTSLKGTRRRSNSSRNTDLPIGSMTCSTYHMALAEMSLPFVEAFISYRTPDFVCPNCKTSVLINTNARQQQGRPNPFHEWVKLSFRFSAKRQRPPCLLASIRREHKSSGQGDHTHPPFDPPSQTSCGPTAAQS